MAKLGFGLEESVSSYEFASRLLRLLADLVGALAKKRITKLADVIGGISTSTEQSGNMTSVVIRIGVNDPRELRELAVAFDLIVRELIGTDGLLIFEHLLASAILGADMAAESEMNRIRDSASTSGIKAEKEAPCP